MENKQTEIEQARAILKQHGYFVDNLWHIRDVTDRYDCNVEEAYRVLDIVLTSESTMNHIWLAIDFECDWLDIELKGEEDNEN